MHKLHILLLGVTILGSGLVACGDDGSSGSGGSGTGGAETGGGGAGTGGSGADLATQFCEASIASAELCGGAAEDLETCKAAPSTQCAIEMVDPARASAYFGCVETECPMDSCVHAEGATSPEADAYEESCLETVAACKGSVNDDICYLGPVLKTIIADATECLSEACVDVEMCFAQALPEVCLTPDS